MRKDEKRSVEASVLRWYRWAVAGIAAVLLAVAGVMTVMDNYEAVLQEKSVEPSEIYPFSYLSQESGADSDEVYYSDSFFDRSNSAYDHELARASMALSMTAFKKMTVDSFLGELEYEDPVFYRYDQQNDENKAALVICHKNRSGSAEKQAGIVIEDRCIIAIAVRGGGYGDEWGSNGRIGYEGKAFGYHYGFCKAAEDAVVQLKEYAADNSLDLGSAKIWITGFSRGAAVANVMGALLTGSAVSEPGNDAGVTVPPENLFDYTFASPSTVSESLLIGEVQGIYNVVNPLDIVPRLPMDARGISQTAKGKTVRYNWDYTKYGTDVELPSESESAQLEVVELMESALAFATRNEVRYVDRIQDQVMIPALKKAMGKGADISKRNVGTVLVKSLPGVAVFLKNELDQLDFTAQLYVAGILSGRKSLRLEKEHWPETYWGWMVKVDRLEY